jgi:ABC-2 type transport system ATP-binding protein
MDEFAVRTEGLTRQFDTTVAVQKLDLHIRRGEIYGFLGPNGAGKTTTLLLLLGLLKPTAGRIHLFGRPLAQNLVALKRHIGVAAEEPITSLRMTGWEAVRYFADLNGSSRVEERMESLFHTLELWDARHALVPTYSRGMRQKLSLIRALIHKPELLILDEPVSGLDPYGILQVREVIEAHHREGGTVLISSHILSEIERSADRVGIIHQGRLLVEDTIDGIRHRLGRNTIVRLELLTIPPGLVPALENVQGVERVTAEETALTIHVATADDLRPLLFQTVVDYGGTILEMRRDEMSLEEAFVTITHQNIAQLAGAA